MTKSGSSSRPVDRILIATRTLEGGGFSVRRPFPTRTLSDIDPFLLLDEMGPTDYPPGEAKGAPDHPHRGFETVTYLLAGAMQHRDSHGSSGRLGPGDVQWMTAGGGVVHSEMPEEAFQEKGGRMHGFQLWVNLPRKDKMIRPRYQDTPSSRIPVAVGDGGKLHVKVIAGESLGASAVIETRTPIAYLHATIQPGGRWRQPVSPDWNVFAYVFGGEGTFGEEERPASDGQAVIFGKGGDSVSIAVRPEAKGPMEMLLIGGKPLGEPVVRYGPFVMNAEEEIVQAIEDYRAGRMGEIAP